MRKVSGILLRITLVALISGLYYPICYAQNKIDSLFTLLKWDKEDTNKIVHLNALGWRLSNNNPDTAIILSNQAVSLAKKINAMQSKTSTKVEKKWLANSFNNLGVYYYTKGDFQKGLNYHFQALKLNEDMFSEAKQSAEKQLAQSRMATCHGNIANIYNVQGDYQKALDHHFKALKMDGELENSPNPVIAKRAEKGIIRHLGNIGLVYEGQGEYPRALDYYFKALKMDEKLKNESGIGRHTTNIANVYHQQGEYLKALGYHLKALKIFKELGDKASISSAFSNMGNVYRSLADYPKSLEYHLMGLKIDEELGNKWGVATALCNIGNVYDNNRDYSKALNYYLKALKINEEIGDKNGYAMCLGNIGGLYMCMLESASESEKITLTEKAEKYLLDALKIDKEIGAQDEERNDESNLSELYEKTGKYELALGHYKKAMVLKDSLFSEEKHKEITRKEMNYEFDKKEATSKAGQDKKDAVTKIVIYSVSAGFGLVLLLAVFIFRGYRQKKKANVIISQQKQMVEEKQKEILDSIHYAKRIQQSLMPTEKYILKKINKA